MEGIRKGVLSRSSPVLGAAPRFECPSLLQESRKAEEQCVTWKHEIQQLSQVQRERCWIAQKGKTIGCGRHQNGLYEENWNFPWRATLAGLQDLRAAERQHQHQEERVQKVHAELVTERSCTEERVEGGVRWGGMS